MRFSSSEGTVHTIDSVSGAALAPFYLMRVGGVRVMSIVYKRNLSLINVSSPPPQFLARFGGGGDGLAPKHKKKLFSIIFWVDVPLL